MEVVNEGRTPQETEVVEVPGICTQEPGDNCWLQLD